MRFLRYGLSGQLLKLSFLIHLRGALLTHFRQTRRPQSGNQTYICSLIFFTFRSFSLSFLVTRYIILCQVLSQELCDRNSLTRSSHSSRSLFSSSSDATRTNSSGVPAMFTRPLRPY